MLTLGWSDGSSFIPVAFSLLSSRNGKKLICPADRFLNKRTVGCMKRAEAMENTTEVMLKLLDSAKGIPAKYLLFDSWFAFPKTIANVVKRRIDVICMLKISTKIHYLYEGEWMNLKSIYNKISHSSKGNIIGSVVAGIRESRKCAETISVKIVFVKDRLLIAVKSQSEQFFSIKIPVLKILKHGYFSVFPVTRLNMRPLTSQASTQSFQLCPLPYSTNNSK